MFGSACGASNLSRWHYTSLSNDRCTGNDKDKVDITVLGPLSVVAGDRLCASCF